MKAFEELSEDQIERIRDATEHILENTGFKVTHKGLRDLARSAGATVVDSEERVLIPRHLLRELLAMVPSSYTVSGLNGEQYTVGGGRQHCLAIVTDPWIVDYDTQKPRRPCLADIRRHTIIAQKLDVVTAVSRMDFPVTDVDGPASSLRALEEHLLNYSKHIFVYAASLESYHQWLEIGDILAQGGDLSNSRLMSVAVAIVSPLTLTDINAELLMSACAHNFPIVPTICPMAGSTSPYSLASTLLLGHTENIFLAALAQIIKPGQPYLYLIGPSVTDMKSGHDLYYTMDKVLWKAASVQMAKSYGIPVMAESGGTMTYQYDQQNGAEGMLFMLAAHSSGCDMLSGIGSCHNANGMSAEMMLIQTAWLEAAKFLNKGINTDDLHLGLDNIKNAGPTGNYLMDDLTMEFMRGKEFFASDLFDYSGGCKPMLERAHDRVDEMVSDFISSVPENVQENLRRYFSGRLL